MLCKPFGSATDSIAPARYQRGLLENKVAPALREQPGARHGKEPLPMQDETSRAGAAEPIDARRLVLGLLLAEQDQRPWLPGEIELEIGDRIATVDAVDQLHAEGLVHRLGEFVFATRAAVNMERIAP